MYDAVLDRAVFNPDIGLNTPTALLVAGLLLLLWAVAGGLIIRLVLRLISRNATGAEQPTAARNGRIQRLQRPDGTELQIERYGRESGPALIFTHGWGTDSTERYALKRQLSDRFQVIVWDLAGVSESTGPRNNDYSLEKLANDTQCSYWPCRRPASDPRGL